MNQTSVKDTDSMKQSHPKRQIKKPVKVIYIVFSRSIYLEQEKLSTNWDLNLDPSVSA